METPPGQLPTKLAKEPLIAVLFEVRFSAKYPASTLLPGVFYDQFPSPPVFERLPIAQLPANIVDLTPELRYAPSISMLMDGYAYQIGDRSILVSCEMPYKGWTSFRKAIDRAIGILRDSKIVDRVERFSLKYVDLLEIESLTEQHQAAKLKIELFGEVLHNEIFHLRVEKKIKSILHVIQVAAGASVANADGTKRAGLILETDSIILVEESELVKFWDSFDQSLEVLHHENKTMFINSLNSATLSDLGPVYV